MCFFMDARRPMEGFGPPLGLAAGPANDAVRLADEIWDDVWPEDPANGYVLVDTRSNKIIHIREKPAPLTMTAALASGQMGAAIAKSSGRGRAPQPG